MMHFRIVAVLLCLALCTGPGFGQNRKRDREVRSEKAVWTERFDHNIKFQSLVDENLLVVGTQRHLHGLDPQSGRTLWRKRGLEVEIEDVIAVPGTELILINEGFGGRFSDRETSVIALDRRTGDERWESKLIRGRGLQVRADPASGLLVLVSVRNPHGEDEGIFAGILPGKGFGSGFEREPVINALDLATGKLLWSEDYGSKVDMRPSLDAAIARGERKSKIRPFDLGLYQLPIVDGGQVFVAYKGLTCYDARTGKRLWHEKYDVREGELALSDAEPILDGDVIYTSGEGRIRALDRRTGKQVWRSDDFGVIPELFFDDRAIYGRLGGRFYKILDEEWTWKGGYGAVAIDRRTGERLWRYSSGNDSITNLTIVGDRVWFGDEDKLVGLDRETGKRVLHESHKLDNRPVICGYNEHGQVVLVSDKEAAGYETREGRRLWYAEHNPIGPGFWKRFSAGLLMTSGAVLSLASFAAANFSGLLPAVPSPAIRVSGVRPISLFNTRGFLIRGTRRTGRAFWNAGEGMLGVTRFAHLTGSHHYFITKVKGTDQALAGVNLTTGETDRVVELPSRTPNIVIDEVNGMVFQTRGRSLVALGL